jgi:alkylation response protein AidB-like acyl-CoA dehydrogenase
MTNQFDLTDEQRQIQEMAQAFTADALTPHAGEWDEKHIFPRDTIRAAAELGSARSMFRRRAAASASGGWNRR